MLSGQKYIVFVKYIYPINLTYPDVGTLAVILPDVFKYNGLPTVIGTVALVLTIPCSTNPWVVPLEPNANPKGPNEDANADLDANCQFVLVSK